MSADDSKTNIQNTTTQSPSNSTVIQNNLNLSLERNQTTHGGAVNQHITSNDGSVTNNVQRDLINHNYNVYNTVSNIGSFAGVYAFLLSTWIIFK